MTRLGVLLLPTDPWPETLARARRLEALGFDHLWTYDHLSWRRYRDRPWHAAVPWLTGIAASTSRIRVGTMVASPNFRHPVTLAKDATTLDHVSGGRLTLGVGAGGVGFDSTVLGGDLLAPAERAGRLTEFVEVLDRLLREPSTSHRGRWYTVDDARMLPGCMQRPRVPIALAAAGPVTIRLAGRPPRRRVDHLRRRRHRPGAGRPPRRGVRHPRAGPGVGAPGVPRRQQRRAAAGRHRGLRRLPRPARGARLHRRGPAPPASRRPRVGRPRRHRRGDRRPLPPLTAGACDNPGTSTGEALTTGWETDVPAADTLLRRNVLNLCAGARHLADLRGGRVEQADDLVLMSDTGSPDVFLNRAVVLRPLVRPDDASALLDALGSFYGDGAVALVSSWPTPDLSAGLSLMGHPPFMVRPPAPRPGPGDPAGVDVVPVRDERALADWERILVEGYPLDGLLPFTPGSVLPSLPDERGDVRLFVAYVDGDARGCSMSCTAEGLTQVEWVATLPSARGAGVGAAVTWAATLPDPALPAALISSDLGRRVYERMGYVALTRFTLWYRAA